MFYAVGDFVLGCGHNGKTMYEQIVEVDKLRSEENNREEKEENIVMPEHEEVQENYVSEEEVDSFDMGL